MVDLLKKDRTKPGHGSTCPATLTSFDCGPNGQVDCEMGTMEDIAVGEGLADHSEEEDVGYPVDEDPDNDPSPAVAGSVGGVAPNQAFVVVVVVVVCGKTGI